MSHGIWYHYKMCNIWGGGLIPWFVMAFTIAYTLKTALLVSICIVESIVGLQFLLWRLGHIQAKPILLRLPWRYWKDAYMSFFSMSVVPKIFSLFYIAAPYNMLFRICNFTYSVTLYAPSHYLTSLIWFLHKCTSFAIWYI